MGAGKAWVEGSGLRGWEENERLANWDKKKEPYERPAYSGSYRKKKIALGIVPFHINLYWTF